VLIEQRVAWAPEKILTFPELEPRPRVVTMFSGVLRYFAALFEILPFK
jgi:hypothetical protein